jgi:mRNA interferase HigB
MRIIALRTLRDYWETHASARPAPQAWADHVRQVEWNSPDDLAQEYGRDVLLPDQRAVFKIKGNQYRLVVRINYQQQIVFIRFIGTHAEYDRIDVINI